MRRLGGRVQRGVRQPLLVDGEAATAELLRWCYPGVSTIGLKSYEKGREKFQGETLHYVWLDEEPPADVYTEALTRTNIVSAPVFLTFTPLLGMSETVRRFLLEPSPDRHVTTMVIDDAEHFTPEQRKQIIASYPSHEREARLADVRTIPRRRLVRGRLLNDLMLVEKRTNNLVDELRTHPELVAHWAMRRFYLRPRQIMTAILNFVDMPPGRA